MAQQGLEYIKDVVFEYADKYAKAFSDGARRTFKGGTGRLANSYRGVAKFQEGSFSIEVYGEDYGIYQDSGVSGYVNDVSPNPKSFYPPGKFKHKVIGGDLPFPIRLSIATNGLKPKPFLQDSVDSVTPQFVSALEEAGVKDIDSFMTQLTKIEVK